MHEHDGCKHKLKYCEHCDVVYCGKCKREWGKENTVYVPQPYYPWTSTYGNDTVSSGTAFCTDRPMTCTHSK